MGVAMLHVLVVEAKSPAETNKQTLSTTYWHSLVHCNHSNKYTRRRMLLMQSVLGRR